MLAVALTFVVHQLDAGVSDPALDEARLAIEQMRETLRAVEHGLQEANDLHDTRAYDCVKTGQPAIAHHVESAEQWNALLEDAVKDQDAALAQRLLGHIAEAKREVLKRASDLSTCRLNLEPPMPVPNRTWFGCNDLPPAPTNPAWSGCEKRRGSALGFGLEGLLVVAPIAGLVAVGARGVPFEDYAGLGLESAAGGLVGGLALFVASGAIALAVTNGLSGDNTAAAGAVVGVVTGLGAGVGAVMGMWLDHPTSGRAAPTAAALTYVVLAATSALLIAVQHHLGQSGEEASLAEKTFAFAPALMALSGMLAVPAAWSAFARR